MNKWPFLVALAVMTSLTVASRTLHAYLNGSWSESVDVQAAALRLPDLPEECGPWVQVKDEALPQAAAETLRCYGYLNREYWNPATGDRVSVAVLFGPRGPIAVHTPEICYSSAGTVPLAERAVATVETEAGRDQFWHIQFARADASPSSESRPDLDVWYAWSDGGPWQASEHPRFWMTDSLYKIQLAGQPSADGTTLPCRDFLVSFLPVLRDAIRAP
ncbi:exosortase-associated EpsI family protein [Candidatus Laterigemmans baculatus]|uniref:exosortase-associated EpsI family protein n=1 Tax=Candidatus Laterigemmans baculatus TaxID=2770505 RepID=UPI0013DCDE36|nr:exosortase-associated EpsI family protein [Candidatus Laterigemmans baculatus]